jgi:hypothetical protein
MEIAVFFDAENISAQYVPGILAELKKIGTIVLQHAYADWSLTSSRPWKLLMKDWPIRAVQQFQNGEKQVSDKQIMMDAVEIACKRSDIDTFAIVSSDKGFYLLALKLRDLGKTVIGIGEKKSPGIWCSACNKFLFVDHKEKAEETEKEAPEEQVPVVTMMETAYDACAGGNPNGILLSQLRAKLNKLYPNFTYDKRKFPLFHQFCASFPDSFTVILDGGRSRIKSCHPAKPQTKEGIITNVKKGYAFAEDASHNIYFVYNQDIVYNPEATLREGMHIRFIVAKEPDPEATSTRERNGKAVHVEVIK